MADVTIVGAGNMARGIGTRLLAGGADVQILAPTAEHATDLASELGAAGGSVTGAGLQEPLRGEVVVLAMPYQAALEVASTRRDELDGRVVVDITNPVDWATFDRLVTPADSSAAEEIAKRLPPGAPVVKAFNTTFAGTLSSGEVGGQQLDVLLAGDDEDAKATVARLVEAGGLRAVDTGPLRRARQLEHLGFLHMALQDKLGTGFGSAVKVVTG
jgi:NADPH-dependent F420 reductase